MQWPQLPCIPLNKLVQATLGKHVSKYYKSIRRAEAAFGNGSFGVLFAHVKHGLHRERRGLTLGHF